jgi:hypothetical protein
VWGKGSMGFVMHWVQELTLCSALGLQVRTLLQKPALQKLMQRETEALQLM